MLQKRILPLIAVILSLLVPAGLIAQEPDVSFPVAVVATEGSWVVSDAAGDCELRWEAPGSPTLRVTGSNNERFRQDLAAGELMTIPEVGDAPSCVIRAEVEITDARRYDIAIDSVFLLEITDDDLDALQDTLVLPVALDDDGQLHLATDDYLDIALNADNARPSDVRPGDPVTTQEDETEPSVSGTPVSPELEGRLIDAQLQVFIFEDLMAPIEEGCRVDALDEDALLRLETSTGRYRSELSLRSGGMTVSPGESPMAAAGCLFTFVLHLPAADSYTFTYRDNELGRVSFTEMEALSAPHLLAIDAEGNRSPDRGIPLATPVMTSQETPNSGQLPDGQFQVVGRLNLWTSGPDDAPFGCAAGPYSSGIYPGAQVVVRDETGAIIGYGDLAYSDRSGSTVCAFDFTVTVPEATFYTFDLGNGASVVRSFADLELWNWHIYIDTVAP